MKAMIGLIVILALLIGGAYTAWLWGPCRHWCDFGESLQINSKTGEPAEKDRYARDGQQGVMAQMRGPGRHFLDPWHFDVAKVPETHIAPGHVGLVKNNTGKDLPPDRFLAGPDEKGTQKRVLTPGAWRLNTFGVEVKQMPATMIEPGYVGVQTLREGSDKGVLSTVLQAGYYNINPFEIRIDQIEIGYRVWDRHIEYERAKVNGRNTERIRDGSGVAFPLADGKQMYLDLVVVWGIFPENAPRIIREYGTVAMVETKIIEPQVLSICKNAGSNLTTQQFIEGATRAKFQQDVTESLKQMGHSKGIDFLIALVRQFHPDQGLKKMIQARMLAEEEKMTLAIEQQRDTIAADLEKAKRAVDVAEKDYDAETRALVQEELAEGEKKAAEIKAAADRTVADREKATAEIKAQTITIAGQADADVIEAKKKAEATRLQLFVDAFGDADAYNLATFAENFPADISIEYRYAGPGTLWTDMKDFRALRNGNAAIEMQQRQDAPAR